MEFLNLRLKSLVSSEDYIDYKLRDDSFNQVVALASRTKRIPMTIKGASRFNYLYPAGALLVIKWALENYDQFPKAIEMAEACQNQGMSSTKVSRESRGLAKKPKAYLQPNHPKLQPTEAWEKVLGLLPQ